MLLPLVTMRGKQGREKRFSSKQVLKEMGILFHLPMGLCGPFWQWIAQNVSSRGELSKKKKKECSKDTRLGSEKGKSLPKLNSEISSPLASPLLSCLGLIGSISPPKSVQFVMSCPAVNLPWRSHREDLLSPIYLFATLTMGAQGLLSSL